MYTEKSPLTGGHPTYQNPSRMYKKQVKQFQCLLCAAFLSLFAIALITAIVFSVDEDEIDGIMNGNASLEGKLQAAPGTKPGKPPKPIKLYTSGTVTSGSATGGFEGEGTSQIFDGKFPVTIHLDSIIDPNAWSATADLTWSGVVLHNDTVKGTFSLPAKIMNGTEEIPKTFKGNFEITMAFKWSSNLDIVIPNKVYNCKAIFLAAYKSSMDGDNGYVAQSTTKGATDPNVETCNVLFQGSFYEKSFFCYLTPWWCTDEKLFYWNGGLEFKITKPAPKPTDPPTTPNSPNALKLTRSTLQELPKDGMSVYNGAKILGNVASGWVTILDEAGATHTIWNGEIPGTVALSMIHGLSNDMGGLTWSASVSSNAIRGTFKLLQKTSSESTKLLEGSFFFLLESDPTTSLTTVLESGTEYTSTLSFNENGAVFNGTKIIDFVSHNTSSLDSAEHKAPIIVSGKYDYISKTFIWDGRFQMITMKITKDLNGMPAANSKPVLGSSAFDWKPFAGTPIGSKLIGKVLSGWLTIQDESGTKTIWNGEFPADINAPMFFNPTTNESDLSDEYGHGALWSCSVFHSSLRGSFQLPQYTRFGLVKWLKGSFFFQLESDPSWSLYDVVYPGVNYNSPIHFRNSDQPYNGSKLITFYSHGVETTEEGMGYFAPIIMLGKANKASKAFSWDGRFEMIVKKMSKHPNSMLKSTSNDLRDNELPKPTSEPMPPSTNTLKADASTVGSKLIGKVSTGWVTLQDDSGTKTIWNGELPSTINVPMFYNPTTNVSDLSDEYGHGAIWSCSVFHSSLRGSFQLPQYTKFGLVKWLKGTFFFELESDPSWSLFDAIYPGVNYNSPIHFRNSDQPYNGSKLVQFYSHGAWGAFQDLGYKAHIILLGKSDKLSKSFTWDGRFEMIVKKEFKNIDDKTNNPASIEDNVLQSQSPVLNEASIETSLRAEASVIGSKLLGKVSSGWITVTNSSGTRTIWNGELPAKISMPLFYDETTDMSELSDEYGHGAVWSCSVFHSTLKGSFQLPQYTKFGLVKWVKGNFFFQLESSPNWSLYDAVVPGINYYSPIHFRTAGKQFNDTKLINLYSDGQQSPLDNLGFKAPILLLGQGQGKSKARSFTWDGRFLVVIKKFY